MNHDTLIEQYLAGPGLLRRAITGMTREQLLARPIPGKWSTQEVVCHLADYEPRCSGPRTEDAIMKSKQTSQQSEMSERIRAAVEKNPRKMTLQLAHDLGVPEVEVIRAFPTDRVMELDIGRWQELLQSFEALGSVRVLVSNGAATIEVDGRFGGFSKAGEFFNVQTDSLDMHIRWQQLAAVFAVEKPGHMDGTATRSFQFFDQTGAAAFKVFLNFGGPISLEQKSRFIELRSRFK